MGTFSAFVRDRRGNFAILFVFLAPALLMAGAMAIDVSRMYQIHSQLEYAADAAVLATTQGLTLGDIPLDTAKPAVENYLFANLNGRSLKSTTVKIDTIAVDKTARTVEAKLHTTMATTIPILIGRGGLRIDVDTKAKFSDTEVEVVMALDITGSMGDKISKTSSTTKLKALQTAAGLAIDTLFGDSATIDRVRIGLVPYSEAVNVKPVFSSIKTTGGTSASTTCVYERTGTYKYSDAFANTSAKVGKSTNACPASKIVPLSASAALLKSEIGKFVAEGCTAGHVPIAWSYYMLSPKWNTVWAKESQVAAFGNPGTRKYAIIMTDGEFNTFESLGQNCTGSGTTNSETYAVGLCDAMKASGIKIYAVAFAAGSAAEKLMKKCASSTAGTAFYYNATDEKSLQSAFLAIAHDIQGLRLIN